MSVSWAFSSPHQLRVHHSTCRRKAGGMSNDVVETVLAEEGVFRGGLLYTPANCATEVICVYFHGGGFVAGSSEMQQCRIDLLCLDFVRQREILDWRGKAHVTRQREFHAGESQSSLRVCASPQRRPNDAGGLVEPLDQLGASYRYRYLRSPSGEHALIRRRYILVAIDPSRCESGWEACKRKLKGANRAARMWFWCL